MNAPPPIVVALLGALRSLVRAEVALALGERGAKDFTSRALPPGCPSRRAFAARCRTIPQARREGAGRGAIWICPVNAWHAALTTRRGGVVAATQPTQDLDALLAHAGLRSSRRSS